MLPLRDKAGKYVVRKTMGFRGTQADVIRATQHQDVYMMHVVDGIEAINISHTGGGMGVRVNEGLVWASLDCVALDTACARYCFTTVPMAQAREIQRKENLPTEFIHTVPVARVEGKSIVSDEGYDSPLFRYSLYRYCEQRGVGKGAYHIIGRDAVEGRQIVSVEGHLGTVENGKFAEILEKELWFNPVTMLWDMQKTCFSYARAHDALYGTRLHRDILDAFDENGDGVLDYDEQGKKGQWAPLMRVGAWSGHVRATEKLGGMKGVFLSRAYGLRYGNPAWNEYRHDFLQEWRLVNQMAMAFMMSRMPGEMLDMFTPGATFGMGKWPSWQLVGFFSVSTAIFGQGFPMRIDALSLYAYAFQYADRTQNGGAYTGGEGILSDLEAQNKYVTAVKEGADPLDFTVYVPAGYGKLGIQSVPNLEETNDPAKMFTAAFNGGKEVWKL
jgi:hypothetical protein